MKVSKLKGVDLIKSVNNFNDEDILLIGSCVLAFERVQFLMSSLVAENTLTDAKNLPKLLDMSPNDLLKKLKVKFGENSSVYITFDNLRNDRNAIIHAYGLPFPEDNRARRYYIKKGKVQEKIGVAFMNSFIDRCFQFCPVYDFNEALKSIRNGGNA